MRQLGTRDIERGNAEESVTPSEEVYLTASSLPMDADVGVVRRVVYRPFQKVSSTVWVPCLGTMAYLSKASNSGQLVRFNDGDLLTSRLLQGWSSRSDLLHAPVQGNGFVALRNAASPGSTRLAFSSPESFDRAIFAFRASAHLRAPVESFASFNMQVCDGVRRATVGMTNNAALNEPSLVDDGQTRPESSQAFAISPYDWLYLFVEKVGQQRIILMDANGVPQCSDFFFGLPSDSDDEIMFEIGVDQGNEGHIKEVHGFKISELTWI